jgi:hypothetical protein
MKTETRALPPVRSFAAEDIGALRSKTPVRGASPAGSAPSQKNAVPSQSPLGSLTKLREVTESVAYR